MAEICNIYVVATREARRRERTANVKSDRKNRPGNGREKKKFAYQIENYEMQDQVVEERV